MILFGKLPAHGDFIARGLLAAERVLFDDWLSASLDDARGALGDQFDDRFDQAPPWLYRGRGGGALAPSQDATGRRFPALLISREGDEAMSHACEELLYRAIGESWTADRLVDEAATLDTATPTVSTPDDPAPRWWTDGGDGFAPATLDGDSPPSLLRAMLGA